MALFNLGPNYTRTGENFLTRIGNGAFYIPIPVVNTFIGGVFSTLGIIWDAAGQLFQGRLLSSLTTIGTGTVSLSTNTFVTAGGAFNPLYWANVGSGIVTGRSAGSHARALTEGATSLVTRPLGIQPMVLRSHAAGVGSINGGRNGPGYWATRAAQERGQDPNARYAAYRSGDGRDHVAALESANARGNSRGM